MFLKHAKPFCRDILNFSYPCIADVLVWGSGATDGLTQQAMLRRLRVAAEISSVLGLRQRGLNQIIIRIRLHNLCVVLLPCTETLCELARPYIGPSLV